LKNTKRIEKFRDEYVNSKPRICYERARIFTESHKKQREAICTRREKDFKK